MAVRHARAQPPSARSASAGAGHVGDGLRPNEEHKVRRIEVRLILESSLAGGLQVRAVLLGGSAVTFCTSEGGRQCNSTRPRAQTKERAPLVVG